MSVRQAVLISMAITGVLAMLAAVSLYAVTEQLSSTVSVLNENLDSVHVALKLEVDLLLHARSRDPMTRATLENNLLEGLRIEKRYIAGNEETALIAEAERELTAYLQTVHNLNGDDADTELNRVLDAIRKVADINIAQARTAELEAAEWNRVANRIGLGVALGVIASVPLVLVWIGYFALRPMLAILSAMKRFGSGERHARVALNVGMEELRRIGSQFNEMADALKRQRENQLAFLAGVSHDLRNPINALNMAVAILSGDRPVPPERQTREMFQVIKRQIEFLNRMVGDLHDAHQIDAGQLALRVEPCDARELSESVCELFRSVSDAHHLVLAAPLKPVPVECDPLRLRQVLNNLVGNAIKYSPGGGDISLKLEQSETEIVFEVSDSGMGIPKEELLHIFEPFRRTKMSRKDIPGTGIGLHVSRRIVEAHHGRIEVESEVGKGTTFRVSLPEKAA
jgi:two-component system, OmpR family, sensor histidine kinase MtrB